MTVTASSNVFGVHAYPQFLVQIADCKFGFWLLLVVAFKLIANKMLFKAKETGCVPELYARAFLLNLFFLLNNSHLNTIKLIYLLLRTAINQLSEVYLAAADWSFVGFGKLQRLTHKTDSLPIFAVDIWEKVCHKVNRLQI